MSDPNIIDNSDLESLSYSEVDLDPHLSDLDETIVDSDHLELEESIKSFSIEQKPITKRLRDSPETSTGPNSIKRARSVNMLPLLADLVAGNSQFVLDIISDDPNNEFFTVTQGNQIMENKSENISEIKYDWSGFDRGKVRYVCNNDFSKKWLIETIPTLEGLWTNAALKLVDEGSPPKLIKSTMNMSVPTLEPPDAFTVIGAQNPSINTKYWRIISSYAIVVFC